MYKAPGTHRGGQAKYEVWILNSSQQRPGCRQWTVSRGQSIWPLSKLRIILPLLFPFDGVEHQVTKGRLVSGVGELIQ